jgi:hypothetical protein
VDTVSQGETVVAVPGSSEVRRAGSGAGKGPGPGPDALARRLGAVALADEAQPGAQVGGWGEGGAWPPAQGQ